MEGLETKKYYFTFFTHFRRWDNFLSINHSYAIQNYQIQVYIGEFLNLIFFENDDSNEKILFFVININ